MIIDILNASVIDTTRKITVSYYERNPGAVNIIPLMENGDLATTSIKNQIRLACNEDKVRPITDKVAVVDPTQIDYEINFTYFLPNVSDVSYSEIEKNISDAVEEYVRWQGSKIGRDINPSELHKRLMQTGVKRVEITSPVYTVVGEGDNQDIVGVAKLTDVTIINGGPESE